MALNPGSIPIASYDLSSLRAYLSGLGWNGFVAQMDAGVALDANIEWLSKYDLQAFINTVPSYPGVSQFASAFLVALQGHAFAYDTGDGALVMSQSDMENFREALAQNGWVGFVLGMQGGVRPWSSVTTLVIPYQFIGTKLTTVINGLSSSDKQKLADFSSSQGFYNLASYVNKLLSGGGGGGGGTVTYNPGSLVLTQPQLKGLRDHLASLGWSGLVSNMDAGMALDAIIQNLSAYDQQALVNTLEGTAWDSVATYTKTLIGGGGGGGELDPTTLYLLVGAGALILVGLMAKRGK